MKIKADNTFRRIIKLYKLLGLKLYWYQYIMLWFVSITPKSKAFWSKSNYGLLKYLYMKNCCLGFSEYNEFPDDEV